MASDFLLEIEGIKGESAVKGHEGALDIESFSFGVSNPGSFAGGGGGGAGKVSVQDFHFTTRISKASPVLFTRCATGEHIKKAVLYVRKAGGDQQQDYYTVTLSDLLVSSYQNGGSEGADVPVDQFSLNYSKIEIVYLPQNPDGSRGEPVTGGFDFGAARRG